MAADRFDKADFPEDSASASDDSASPNEHVNPAALRPQEIPRVEGEPLPPRPREQALPEKDDDRFFDRWVVDKARVLGGRAVKQPALEKLKQTVRSFAEWRSLRHAPAAEHRSQSDKELVASTPERINNLQARADRFEAKAEETKREATRHEAEVDEKAGMRDELRPALRGSGADLPLVVFANLTVFGVDFYIIQVALETLPGTAETHRFTAAMLGAGAVVVGDILGWMAAASSFRRDGSLQRPRPAAIAFVTSLLILAVWFFGELGEFREAGLKAAENRGAVFGDPTFFTLAQILFLIASAVSSFAYIGRRTGRELHASHAVAAKQLKELQAKVESLQTDARDARQAAAEAPALCLEAEERIRSREKIAVGEAQRDLKQGEYLESLVVPEYMRERAAVESGIYRWLFGDEEEQSRLGQLGPAAAIITTLAAGGITYWVVGSALISIVTGVIVAAAIALALASRNEDGVERGHPWKAIAEMVPSARKGSERATDIERLVAADSADTVQNGNGNGRGKRATYREMQERFEKMKEIFDGDDRDR
jgi:hypothetical protein